MSIENFISQQKPIEAPSPPKKSLRIEVDGAPLVFPDYLPKKGLNSYRLWSYLQNAYEMRRQKENYGHWMVGIGNTEMLNLNALQRLAYDPRFPDYLAALVRHGPDATLLDHGYTNSTSLLAEVICPQRYLEVVIPSPQRQEQCFRGWGTSLKKGMLVLRGNAAEVSSLDGGTLIIDGDVQKIQDCRAGIIYVTGNVARLAEVETAIVVVAGEIDTFEMKAYYVSDDERMLPPFIFTTHDLIGTRVGRTIRFGALTAHDASYRVQFLGATATPKEKLVDWKPQRVRPRALALCRGRIRSVLDELYAGCQQIDDPETMGRLWKQFIIGYFTGRQRGHYYGLIEALGPGD